MSETIDKMLDLTADIADELLRVKDAEQEAIPDQLKIKIISLVELASSLPDPRPDEQAATEAEETVEVEEPEEAPVCDESSADEDKQEEVASAEFEEEADAMLRPVEEFSDEVTIYDEIADTASQEKSMSEPSVDEPLADQAPTETSTREASRLSEAQLISSFSINDLFLFRREIFHGDKTAFNKAMGEIAALGDDRRELQYYLVEHLALNLNEHPGKEFYEALVGFFK